MTTDASVVVSCNLSVFASNGANELAFHERGVVPRHGRQDKVHPSLVDPRVLRPSRCSSRSTAPRRAGTRRGPRSICSSGHSARSSRPGTTPSRTACSTRFPCDASLRKSSRRIATRYQIETHFSSCDEKRSLHRKCSADFRHLRPGGFAIEARGHDAPLARGRGLEAI